MEEKKRYHKSLGRVHWLLHSLPSEFKGAYVLSYDYAYHRYLFYRMNGKRIYDVFIVMRTSKQYFRACYCNAEYQEFELFGAYKSSWIAEKMYDLYLLDKNRPKN